MNIQFKVNGKAVKLDAAPNTLLVQALRNNLQLTGTHVGCDTAQCGACTVMMNGRSIKSCNILASQAEGAEITTIEGLAAADGTLHPMQAAFKECHGLQCGFCTPGMVMSAVDLCQRHPKASEAQIREQLEGNLCRCTGYQNIVKAVQHAASAMQGAAQAADVARERLAQIVDYHDARKQALAEGVSPPYKPLPFDRLYLPADELSAALLRHVVRDLSPFQAPESKNSTARLRSAIADKIGSIWCFIMFLHYSYVARALRDFLLEDSVIHEVLGDRLEEGLDEGFRGLVAVEDAVDHRLRVYAARAVLLGGVHAQGADDYVHSH